MGILFRKGTRLAPSLSPPARWRRYGRAPFSSQGPSDSEAGRPPNRPANIRTVALVVRALRARQQRPLPPQRTCTARCHKDDRALQPEVFTPRSHPGIWLAHPSATAGSGRLATGVGTYHVFKGFGEPQPARERVAGLAIDQPATRRVGALLELESDAQRPGLVHTGSVAGTAAGGVTAPPLSFVPRPVRGRPSEARRATGPGS